MIPAKLRIFQKLTTQLKSNQTKGPVDRVPGHLQRAPCVLLRVATVTAMCSGSCARRLAEEEALRRQRGRPRPLRILPRTLIGVFSPPVRDHCSGLDFLWPLLPPPLPTALLLPPIYQQLPPTCQHLPYASNYHSTHTTHHLPVYLRF